MQSELYPDYDAILKAINPVMLFQLTFQICLIFLSIKIRKVQVFLIKKRFWKKELQMDISAQFSK